MNFTGKRNIPKTYVEEWILSPVVKRSISQTVNIINEIHSKYGVPEEIVIEMAREKNSEEKRKSLTKFQSENEKTNKEIFELMEGKSSTKKNGLFEKLKYWKEQNGVCLYSGNIITRENLINNPEGYEIDHIIPRSISFDDSRNNKVLVCREENQQKKNMSPFQYLSINGRYEEYKSRIMKSSLNRFKKENLLFEGDLDRYARNFIARNLVDTRYATREILNMLKKYYMDNEHKVKIKSVTGLMTSQVRKMWEFRKSREISHAHHAQDALIMLASEKIVNRLSNVKDYYDGDENRTSVNMKTGEILSDEEYRKLFKHEYGERIKNYDRYRYSHYVDKKPNRQLTNETIYSTRKVVELEKKGKKEVEVENEYIITTLNNIYDKTNKNIKKKLILSLHILTNMENLSLNMQKKKTVHL
ncbi:MAG: type II CRISPR RNA-guided endonuclease Cas9 [Fusobacteriaceae bacterium]